MDWRRDELPPLTETQFLSWQGLIEQRTGMFIAYERRSLLQSGLSMRMREAGYTDYDEYYEVVQRTPEGVREWSALVDRVMVRETRFFRNSESLDLVRGYLEHRVQSQPENKPLNLWSVGCCTGEEPYSLAIECEEVFAQLGRAPKYGVSGTDISLSSLEIARSGVYKRRQMSNMKPEWIERHFEQLSLDEFSIKEGIKKHVCFSMSNMIETDKNPMRNLDVIYCQNVLVYFKEERKHQVLDNLTERLAPGGLLVIAQGETSKWSNPLLERVNDNLTLAFVRQEQSESLQTTH